MFFCYDREGVAIRDWRLETRDEAERKSATRN